VCDGAARTAAAAAALTGTLRMSGCDNVPAPKGSPWLL
jgi:hypothetical protein